MTDEDKSANTDQFRQFVLTIEVPSRFRRTIQWLRRHLPWYRRGKWIEIGATEGGTQFTAYSDGSTKVTDGEQSEPE